MDKYNFISFGGIFCLMLIAWIFSENKRNINWRVLVWGLIIQLTFIFIVFIFPAGTKIFLSLNDIILKILDSSMAGTKFLFGRLAIPPGGTGENGEASLGFILAFQAFPSIVFFSSLVSLLYYYGILPFIIRKFSFLFTRLMKISGAESLSAASNFFVGIEALLPIRPHLRKMTKSELCTVITAGIASASSNILGLYVFCLQSHFPKIAAHLISASFISIPAAIIMSKIVIPESEKPETLGDDVKDFYEKEKSVFEAIINGANTGVKLIIGIAALLLAVLGLVQLTDLVLIGAGGKLNSLFSINIDWSLKGIMGYVFYPFTLILGIPHNDASIVSKIIGERLIITEVGAYQDLADAISKNLLSQRSVIITSYVLCGFAHIASLSIFIGGASALAPEKTGVLAKIGIKSLFAATLATLMTGCIAGTFLTNCSFLMK